MIEADEKYFVNCWWNHWSHPSHPSIQTPPFIVRPYNYSIFPCLHPAPTQWTSWGGPWPVRRPRTRRSEASWLRYSPVMECNRWQVTEDYYFILLLFPGSGRLNAVLGHKNQRFLHLFRAGGGVLRPRLPGPHPQHIRGRPPGVRSALHPRQPHVIGQVRSFYTLLPCCIWSFRFVFLSTVFNER